MIATAEKTETVPTIDELEDELVAGASPELSPAQQIEHEHYGQICTLNAEVCQARSAWAAAKDRAGALKKEFDALNGELLDLIRNGPDPQTKLPLTDGEPGEAATSETAPAWSDEWRKVEVGELDIPIGVVNKLIDNNITTLGDLDDYWKANKQLTDIKGIGGATADKVADAFAKYGTEHPELYGQQPAEVAPPDMAATETGGPLDNDDEADDDEEDDEENWDGDDL